MSKENRVILRDLEQKDFPIIENSFKEQGWNKNASQYEDYFKEQLEGKRSVIVAFIDNMFAGYTTIVWESSYMIFRENNIPEIVDLNVLIKYRRKGIATMLLDRVENIIKTKSNVAGIGVGLLSDYGNAQRLYVKRGYIPDGRGIYKAGKHLEYFDTVEVDDDLVLYFTKELE